MNAPLRELRSRVKFWQAVSFMEPEQLVGVARAAEEAGFHGLLLADHLFFPAKLGSKYPYSEDGAPMFDGAHAVPRSVDDDRRDGGRHAAAAASRRSCSSCRCGAHSAREDARHALAADRTAASRSAPAPAGSARSSTRSASTSTRAASAWTRWSSRCGKLWSGAVVEHHGRFFDFAPLADEPGAAPPRSRSGSAASRTSR